MKPARTLVAVLLTLACCWSAVTVFERLVAWELFRLDSSPEGVKQALKWDPGMPDFYFQLGLTKRDLPEHQDLGESISSLEHAVSLNPYRWDYLNELARGYELADRDADALKLYEESVRLNPRSALYHWRLANYYLRTLGPGESLGNFREALTLEPSYMRPAAHLLLLAGATAQDLISMCPAQPEPRLALLELLETDDKHSAELIDLLWAELLKSSPPPSLSDGAFHLDYLRRKSRFEEARKNWISLCRTSGIVDEAFETRGNLVWNGGFELPVFGIGLDWHVSHGKTHSVRLAEGEGTSGSTGFRIDFTGQTNPDLVVLKQTVLLTSGREHKLTFRARSRSLTSDRGIYLQVTDAATSSPLVVSPEIRGTSDWGEVVLLIPADPSSDDTRAVDLMLIRDRSWRIDNKLGGSVWLDDVAIRSVGPDS
jgi:tetratricopeptide (TPR) repeat protein